MIQLIQSSSLLKQLFQKIARLAGVPLECWCAALWLSQSQYFRDCSILLPVSASSGSHIAPLSLSLGPSFVLFLNALYYLSTVYYFCASVCLSLSTVKPLSCFSLYGFVTRASAPVCVFVTAMCFCGCMCIDVYEFPLKRTREEVVEHSFFRCFLPSSFQEERNNFFPSSFLPSSSISCRRNDVRNLSTINDVLLLLAPPSAAQQQQLQKNGVMQNFMLGMNAARFCA